MEEIGPPDAHHFKAATGWLELHCPGDALEELNLISAANQQHPAILELRWMILAGQEQWEAALDVATTLLSSAPNHSAGWLHRAYSLRRTPNGGLEKAWEALLPAADKFRKEPIIFYNLSCYACQMRKLDEARQWFRMALKLVGKAEIQGMALADEDLEPLWEEIRQL